MTRPLNGQSFHGHSEDGRPLHQQVGALCYRVSSKGRVKVLMVTSRGTGRWILPKGWPINGLTAAQAAATEAWEEAGVSGQVLDRVVGQFTYDKARDGAPPLACRVDVFPLRVDALSADFPECTERKREWMSLERAAKQVGAADVSALLRAFSPDDLV